MFSFLTGTLGELLAPIVTETEQLHQAIEDNKLEKVRFLLHERRVDPTAKNSGGNSPIHTAAYFGRVESIGELLSFGVDINDLGRGNNTSLHFAASQGHLDAVNFLIAQGANLVIKNSNGKGCHDVAEGFELRQRLLPLYFQAERAAGLAPEIHGATVDLSAPRAPIAPPPMGVPPTGASPMSAPPMHPSPGAPPNSAAMGLSHMTPVYTHAHLHRSRPGGASHSNVYRPIVADGFTSSAGDPVLGAKYGHQKVDAAVAVPPPATPVVFGGPPRTQGVGALPLPSQTGLLTGDSSYASALSVGAGPHVHSAHPVSVNAKAYGAAAQKVAPPAAPPAYVSFGSNPFGAPPPPMIGVGGGLGTGMSAVNLSPSTSPTHRSASVGSLGGAEEDAVEVLDANSGSIM